MKTQEPRTIYLKDYRPAPYIIDHTSLDVRLHPTQTEVIARLTMRCNPRAETKPGEALVLDGEQLKLVSVAVDGVTLATGAYKLDEQSLTILEPPTEPFTLDITTVCEPEANKALNGLYRSGELYCTQCEPEGFRHITYYLDRPDVLAKFRVRIEADATEAPVLLANGNLVEEGKVPSGRHFAVWEDPHPKPSYLFALVGGKLGVITDHFTTEGGRKVELRVYCDPGKEDRCDWAMECLKASMRWDETRFGLEYDLDIFMIVAVSDFNMGAMENKGLNIFNDRLILARPDTATDSAYEAIEGVIAHEYFHNWTGNRVTCRDWFQLCLKEGLTVFRDQEFTSDVRSRSVARIENVLGLRARQFAEDSGPLAHPVRPGSFIEINNFYTATVYQKGAELCRMIMMIVGVEAFRKGLDLYFERHDGTAATVEDFVAAMADANDVDLDQFMLWYAQAGTPELTCRLTYSEAVKTARLTVKQAQKPTPGPEKKPLHIPLKLGLLDGHGKDIALTLADGTTVKDGVLHLRKQSESFTFTGIAERPVASLLREFSAPVKLTANLTDGDLEFLIAHDSDTFNRWQSAQTLAMKSLIKMTATVREGGTPKPSPRFARAMARLLADDTLDPSFRALMLLVPTTSNIAQVIGADIDHTAIYAARKAFRENLGRVLRSELERLYDTCVARTPYSPDAASVGLRSLRNAAMSLLAATGKRADLSRVFQHHQDATNMTDTMAAIWAMSDEETPKRREMLDSFYERWQDDALVLDNWFSTQAVSARHGTADAMRELMQHPKFSMQNPNRLRSVLSSFAWGNLVQFNAPDGSGYKLVADAVLEVDKFNPQIAARQLTSFEAWRTLEGTRCNLARAELQRVAQTPNLSRDVYEIVTKTLGE